MVGNSTNQRKVLKEYKYPKKHGLYPKKYYSDATNVIRKYHKRGHNLAWLIAQATILDTKASLASGKLKKQTLTSNAKAIRAYAKNFSKRVFTILPDVRLSQTIGSINIVAEPTMHVIEGKKEKLIRLEFSRPPRDSDRYFKILCQWTYDNAIISGFTIRPKDVVCLHVSSGTTHYAIRKRSRITTEIINACTNISGLWPGI